MNIRLKSRGLTLIELLVVVGLIGLVVALALPATISAREAVRRAHCANNLKQIGLAFRLYADAHGMFAGGTECPWTIGVLPYLEQKDAASRYQTGRPSSSPENQTIATTMISAFLCPSERNVVLSNGWVVSNYAANAAILVQYRACHGHSQFLVFALDRRALMFSRFLGTDQARRLEAHSFRGRTRCISLNSFAGKNLGHDFDT